MEIVGEINNGKFVNTYKGYIPESVFDTILEMVKYSGFETSDIDPKNGISGIFLSTVIPNPKCFHPSIDHQMAEFTVDECFMLKMQGLDLCLRHEDGVFRDVGYVEDQFIMGETQKDYTTINKIYDSIEGIFTISYMIIGGYQDVSLQHCAEYISCMRMIKKTPIELSLCKEGKRPGSSIYLLFTKLYEANDLKFKYGEKNLVYANIYNIERFLKRGSIGNY